MAIVYNTKLKKAVLFGRLFSRSLFSVTAGNVVTSKTTQHQHVRAAHAGAHAQDDDNKIRRDLLFLLRTHHVLNMMAQSRVYEYC